MSLAELSSEYSIVKSTINGWIKEENEMLKKKLCPYFQQEIRSNNSNYDIKTMYTVLGVSRSTYYKSFDKTKSAREIENEELKEAIIRYGAPRIHHILGTEGFNVSIKRVQKNYRTCFFMQ